MIKLLFVLLTLLFSALGIVGLMFPVIPQVPFFVLSALSLCVVSKRFKRFAVGTKLYCRYLKKHVEANDRLKAFLEQ